MCGIPKKLDGIDGTQVEAFVNANRIEDVANYCEFDVLSTYLLFLRYMLVVGELSVENHQQSLSSFSKFIADRIGKRPHLASFAESDLLAHASNTVSVT